MSLHRKIYRNRRGIILLAIISLLTMFMLIGITYVVVSGHFKQSAVVNTRASELESIPRKHFDSAIYQLLRDVKASNSTSDLKGQSLLRDVYGDIVATGTIYPYKSGTNADFPGLRIIMNGTRQVGIHFSLRLNELLGFDQYQYLDQFIGNLVTLHPQIHVSSSDNHPVVSTRITHVVMDNNETGLAHFQCSLPVGWDFSFNNTPSLSKVHFLNGKWYWKPLGYPESSEPASILSIKVVINRRAFSGFGDLDANEPYDAADNKNRFLMQPDEADKKVDNDNDGNRDSQWTDLGFTVRSDEDGKRYKPFFAFLIKDLDGRLNLNAHGNLTHLIDRSPNEQVNPLGGNGSNDTTQQIYMTGQTPSHFLPKGIGYGPAEINLKSLVGKDLTYLLNGRPYTSNPQRHIAGRYSHIDVDLSNKISTNDFTASGVGVHPLANAASEISSHGGSYPGYPDGSNRNLELRGFPLSFNNAAASSFQIFPDLHGENSSGLSKYGQIFYEPFLFTQENQQVFPPYKSFHLGKNRDNWYFNNPYNTNLNNPNFGDSLFTVYELERVLRHHDFQQMSVDQLNYVNGQNARPRSHNVSRLHYLLPNTLKENGANNAHESLTTHSFSIPTYSAVSIPSRNLKFDLDRYVRLYREQSNDPPSSISFSTNTTNNLINNEWIPALEKLDQNRNDIFTLLRTTIIGWRLTHDVPASPSRDDDGLADEDYEVILRNKLIEIFSDVQIPQLAKNLLPYDLRAGLPFDVNHPFGDYIDNNNNGLVDEDTEYPQSRTLYARYLYVLAMLNVYPAQSQYVAQGNQNQIAETAETLAQWAINVVDFRDSDSIMTKFSYDPTPFDGGMWNPTHHVWGTERPELLITETKAFHDRRTEDLEFSTDPDEPGNENKRTTDNDFPDPNYDQRLRPRGSLFVELYNPWYTQSINKSPPEFYPSSASKNINLKKTSANGSPVWRMLVVKNTPENIGIDPAIIQQTNGNQFLMEGISRPQRDIIQRNNLKPNDLNDTIIRGIYFVDPKIDKPGEVIYSGANPPENSLSGRGHGQEVFYCDLGPNQAITLPQGRHAVIGSAIHRPRFDAQDPSLILNPYDPGGNQTYENPIGRRRDYPEAVNAADGTINDEKLVEAYYSATNRFEMAGTQFQIKKTNTSVFPNYNDAGFYKEVPPNDPAGAAVWPWDQNSNKKPISIPMNRSNRQLDVLEGVYDFSPGKSWASLNITEPLGGYPLTLNGSNFIQRNVDGEREGVYTPTLDAPLDSNRNLEWNATIHLQRLANPLSNWDSRSNPYITIDSSLVELTVFNGVSNPEQNNPPVLASRERGTTNGGEPRPETDSRFRNLWRQVSENQRQRADDNTHFHNYQPNDNSFGYLNRTYDLPNEPPTPSKGFSNLNWQNGLFVSQYDLAQVPYSNAFNLLKDFSHRNPVPNVDYQFQSDYRHLLNFYHRTRAAGNGGHRDDLYLHRIMGLTYVPSKFIGTRSRYLRSDYTTLTREQDLLPAEIQLLSSYREPGKINLNTTNPTVWKSFEGVSPTGRQYYTNKTHQDWKNALPAPISGSFETINDSLFLFQNNNNRPFFATNDVNLNNSLVERAFDKALDPRRNSRYETINLSRISNFTTSQSNVYAVWITLGYFEVDNNGDRVREVGVLRGEAKRHRAFFIIDRSIPVGFEPGVNHNVDETILLRRYIE